jgi:hypothetical protein
VGHRHDADDVVMAGQGLQLPDQPGIEAFGVEGAIDAGMQGGGIDTAFVDNGAFGRDQAQLGEAAPGVEHGANRLA